MDFLHVGCQEKCTGATEDRGLVSKSERISAERGLEWARGAVACHPPAGHRDTEVRGCARAGGTAVKNGAMREAGLGLATDAGGRGFQHS